MDLGVGGPTHTTPYFQFKGAPCRAGLAQRLYRDAGRRQFIVGHEEVRRQRDRGIEAIAVEIAHSAGASAPTPRNTDAQRQELEAWAERAGHTAFRVYEDGRRPDRPACRFWDGYKEIG